MQVLLQHDADISVRSCVQQQPDILLPCTGGSTPLHLAAARGSVEICKLLLKTHVGGGGEWERKCERKASSRCSRRTWVGGDADRRQQHHGKRVDSDKAL